MKKQEGIDRIALIDIGSNTIRLVIFDVDKESFYNISEIQNIKVPARLVQYLENDEMNEEGIQVLIELLNNYLTIVEHYDVNRLIAVATAAVRNSKNVGKVVKRVAKETGLNMLVLSDKEEAFYGNYAVRHTFNIYDGITVDIGGGSTEVSLFKNKKVVKSHSFPFGAVSLSNKFFEKNNHADKKALKNTKKWVRKQFEKIGWLADKNLPLIGIGGSARNLAEVYQLHHDYPLAGMHGYIMEPAWIDETLDIFTALNYEQLDSLDGLSQDRKDTIIPATIVFQQLLELIAAPNFVLSNRGLREGVLIHYLNENHNEPYSLYSVPQQTVIRLSAQYNVQNLASNQRIMIADFILRELEEHDLLKPDIRHLELMYYGATLYNLGNYIENDSSSQHTYYVISNTNISGFDHYDRARLALLASYKNRSLYEQYLAPLTDWFTEEEKTLLMKLGSIIKFAEALNDAHVNKVEKIKLSKHKKGGYDLNITYSGNIVSEEFRANKQLNHLERAVGDKVRLHFTTLGAEMGPKK